MNNPIQSLSIAGLLAAGLSLGCDVAEPDAPTDRSAVLVLEVDGAVVEENDVSRSPGVQEGVLELAESHASEVCEGDSVSLDLVLEVDGEQAAVLHGCTDEGPAESIDQLSADPRATGSFWCMSCDQTNDCFACCRCAGESVYTCANAC